MRKLISSLNVCLNGYAGHEAGVHDDESHAYATDQLVKYDGLLLGRKTFELFESYWPGLEETVPLAKALTKIPKYVISNSRKDSKWANCHFLGGDLAKQIQALKSAKGKDLLLLGSVKLRESLRQMNAIDEFEFLIQPLVAQETKALKLAGHRTFQSGVVVARYSGK